MANKKSEVKKNKKQSNQTEETEIKISVDTSLKDIFVADAQNTTFTEEDVKELETVKQENVIETPAEGTKSEEVEEEPLKEETPVQEIIETEEKEIETVDEQPEKVETISEKGIKKEHIPVETVVGIESVVEVKQEQPKKKRMTTKEVYGYHWMGLIYDE